MSGTIDGGSNSQSDTIGAEAKPAKRDVRYRVQSLGRALDLLDLIAKGGKYGVRLSDLARGLSISKASTHAMLQTLLSRNFVADVDAGSGRSYRLGLALAHLGDQAISNISLAEIAVPLLRDLSAQIGCTSRVAILDEGFAVVVGRVDAPGTVRFDAALGRREYPHSSAVGKALLAALPQAEARSIVERIGFKIRTTRTITDPEKFLMELRIIARQGYAIDDEEDCEGVICFGTCVFDRNVEPVGAISFSAIKHGNLQARLEGNIAKLRECADLISHKLGGPPGVEAWSGIRDPRSAE